VYRAVARRPRGDAEPILIRPAGALVVALGALALTACAMGATGRDAAERVDVVEVVAQRCDRPNRFRGVGVVVGPDLVATAAHTVDDELRALSVDGRPATVVRLDARTDLALLQAAVTADDIAWADPDEPALGPAVVHLADGPHDVEIVRSGALIVDDITAHTRNERQVHTFTPGVAPGASGAPLTTARGELLGIVVLDRTDTDEAHAVTAAELRALIATSGEGSPPATPECTTKVPGAGRRDDEG
jgi:S1-C subfamily serine protease